MRKFEVLPQWNYKAIQWQPSGLLVFGQHDLSLNLNIPRVDIGIGSEDHAFTTPTVRQPNEAFTGSSSFKPDDVEVLEVGGK